MNTPLAYSVAGTGNTILLVHGFCETRAVWAHFVPSLAARYQVVSIDLGGFGESPLPNPIVDMATLAAQIRDLLDYLNITEVLYVGHSLGGYVGLAFAAQYPERLRGLSLFHSTALPDTPEKRKTRDNIIEFVQRNGVAAFTDNFVAPLFYAPRHEELAAEIRAVKDIARSTPADTLISITYAMRDRLPHTTTLANLHVPVQYIIGRDDQAVLFEHYAQQILLPRRVDIHILPETAHMGMFERPRETLHMLHTFADGIFG